MNKFELSEGKIVPSGQERPPIWVFSAPDENEKKILETEFRIDAHTLASALDPDEPSRLESQDGRSVLILKTPKNFMGKGQLLFKVASVGLFLFPERLAVVTSEDVPLLSGKDFQSIQSLPGLHLRIIARSIHHFLEHLRIINMLTDEIEAKISVSMENKYLLNLFSLEKSLVYYLNAINSNGFVFEKLKNNGAKLGFSAPQLEFLDDIIIENSQCYRQAEIYSNILASLMDARVSIVSNNLNILMKTLNLVTIGIMVPTLVVSIFSMNVSIPLEKHPMAFWIIMSLAVVSVAGVTLWWRRIAAMLERGDRGGSRN
ncbi:MAG TPA: divalent metal ion transporter [Elusimicrobia bacterium]|nr:divalent metal ion transporter [Elusimicrobiota bacterium]HBT60166.1 divalent metal ion transporter [Elusimicrobiota bacterium]